MATPPSSPARNNDKLNSPPLSPPSKKRVLPEWMSKVGATEKQTKSIHASPKKADEERVYKRKTATPPSSPAKKPRDIQSLRELWQNLKQVNEDDELQLEMEAQNELKRYTLDQIKQVLRDDGKKVPGKKKEDMVDYFIHQARVHRQIHGVHMYTASYHKSINNNNSNNTDNDDNSSNISRHNISSNNNNRNPASAKPAPASPSRTSSTSWLTSALVTPTKDNSNNTNDSNNNDSNNNAHDSDGEESPLRRKNEKKRPNNVNNNTNNSNNTNTTSPAPSSPAKSRVTPTAPTTTTPTTPTTTTTTAPPVSPEDAEFNKLVQKYLINNNSDNNASDNSTTSKAKNNSPFKPTTTTTAASTFDTPSSKNLLQSFLPKRYQNRENIPKPTVPAPSDVPAARLLAASSSEETAVAKSASSDEDDPAPDVPDTTNNNKDSNTITSNNKNTGKEEEEEGEEEDSEAVFRTPVAKSLFKAYKRPTQVKKLFTGKNEDDSDQYEFYSVAESHASVSPTPQLTLSIMPSRVQEPLRQRSWTKKKSSTGASDFQLKIEIDGDSEREQEQTTSTTTTTTTPSIVIIKPGNTTAESSSSAAPSSPTKTATTLPKDKGAQVICPLCSARLTAKENEDPNVTVSSHIDRGCDTEFATPKNKGKNNNRKKKGGKAKQGKGKRDSLSPGSSSSSSSASSPSPNHSPSLSPTNHTFQFGFPPKR